jgi:hypothetical protein
MKEKKVVVCKCGQNILLLWHKKEGKYVECDPFPWESRDLVNQSKPLVTEDGEILTASRGRFTGYMLHKGNCPNAKRVEAERKIGKEIAADL